MRRAGIRGLKNRHRKAAMATKRGKQLETDNLQHVEATLAEFKKQLEDFSARYKAEIGKDPVFRAQFQQMCSNIGVDPLASGKGFWGELLGLGRFYYELGIQIVDACYSSRDRNGGLITLYELKRRLRVMRGRNAVDIGEDDVRRALDKLAVLGGGFGIVEVPASKKVGGRRRMQKMVVTVPRELSTDHTTLIAAATAEGGWVSVQLMADKFGWPTERSRRAIKTLETDGMVWRDEQGKQESDGKRGGGSGEREVLFWFPSMFDTGAGDGTSAGEESSEHLSDAPDSQRSGGGRK